MLWLNVKRIAFYESIRYKKALINSTVHITSKEIFYTKAGMTFPWIGANKPKCKQLLGTKKLHHKKPNFTLMNHFIQHFKNQKLFSFLTYLQYTANKLNEYCAARNNTKVDKPSLTAIKPFSPTFYLNFLQLCYVLCWVANFVYQNYLHFFLILQTWCQFTKDGQKIGYQTFQNNMLVGQSSQSPQYVG